MALGLLSGFRRLMVTGSRHGGNEGITASSRLLLIATATLPLIVGGASVLAEAGGGLYWVAAAMVFAIIGGVANAWVLVIEILR
jgi:hypothetical protein